MSHSTIDSYVTDRPESRPKAGPHPLWRVVTFLASLRLTVVLFALGLVLVLASTVGQVDSGNWQVVQEYVRTFKPVWIKLQIFVPRSVHVPGGFYFPGGWLIGAALLVNLLAAHLTRFRVTWKRSGILMLHAGLIVMLCSELITGLCAVESHMTIAEGETVNFLDVTHEPLTDAGNEFELTLTAPGGPEGDIAAAVPVSLLRPGETIRNDLLPVDVEVLEFHRNSEIGPAKGADTADLFVTRDGMAVKLRPCAAGTGVSGQRDDAPMTRIAFHEKGTGKILGTFLLSLWQYPNYSENSRRFIFAPQMLTAGDKTYTVELRPKRRFTPYAVRLIEFRHDKYIGSDIPRNYSSRVRLTEPSSDEDREILISMNTPLRYDGTALFQSGVLAGAKGTVLQVVRNPGWLMPYISCVMVSLGMVVHFGIQLNGFLRRRAVK
jgi:hypothetical protein